MQEGLTSGLTSPLSGEDAWRKGAKAQNLACWGLGAPGPALLVFWEGDTGWSRGKKMDRNKLGQKTPGLAHILTTVKNEFQRSPAPRRAQGSQRGVLQVRTYKEGGSHATCP